ncbi:MAG: hypothetical protein AABN33_12075 [Acidobacteriota bacterium]
MKPKKRSKTRAWEATVLAFGRRCLSAEDLGKENVEIKRGLAAYMLKHKIRLPAGVTITGVRFGKGHDRVLEATNCYWTFVGWSWDDEQACQQWQYECDGSMVAWQEFCQPRGPDSPPAEVLRL